MLDRSRIHGRLANTPEPEPEPEPGTRTCDMSGTHAINMPGTDDVRRTVVVRRYPPSQSRTQFPHPTPILRPQSTLAKLLARRKSLRTHSGLDAEMGFANVICMGLWSAQSYAFGK